MMKNKVSGKGFVWFMLPHHSSLLKGVKTEIYTGQELGGRTMKGCYLLACPACYLIEPRTTNPRMVPPAMSWALLHQLLIKKMPYKRSHSLILQRHFLYWRSLLPDDFIMCQVDIKQTKIPSDSTFTFCIISFLSIRIHSALDYCLGWFVAS